MSKNKARAFGNLKKTFCRLRPSKIAGVGVFAIRDIPKGTKLFEGSLKQRWFNFKADELAKLDQEVLKMVADFSVIEKDGSANVPSGGPNSLDISYFVNHSKKPNAKTIDKNGDFITFIASRDIKKGEEITTDYSKYDSKYK